MATSKFRILVPIDFSEQSQSAFYQSCNIAQIYDGELLLLHVIEDEIAAFEKFSATSISELTIKIDQRLSKFVEEAIAISKKNVTSKVKFGSVSNMIFETLQNENFNMIVMGFHSANGDKNKPIGSNSLQVIKQASCQVITVKDRPLQNDFKSIILPLDLSKPVSQKVNKTIELAKSWKGSVVNIISVLPQSDDLKVNAAAQQLAKIVSEIESNDIVCNAEIVRMIKGRESVADIVVDYAQRMRGEMIMIITRYESGIANRFGSAAQSIINSIEIPMFSIVPLVNQNSIIH